MTLLTDKVNRKYLIIGLLCTIGIIGVFLSSREKSPVPIMFTRPPLLSKTCLQSYDARSLRKSVFHTSMIHQGAPQHLRSWLENKTGFEIGGPSGVTWGSLGIYEMAATVDVTNFAATTLWESNLKENSPFVWKDQTKGKQYIRDAVDLRGIPNDTYDFMMASHVLEHIANPFSALLEWIRILKLTGMLLIITPLKEVTFDHNREIDRMEHLIDDYNKRINESDLSHLPDILRLHDLSRDPPAGNLDSFKARSEKNFENRGLHQHVFDHELLYYMFICLNLDVKYQTTWGNSNLIIAQKR